ncbi:hypothetical protein FGO68_gene6437 [Halteria grandinella]|uniref:Uncharacterized protein n=1 Tax=Halteria grandinella TaxID=5974 RepID=A0A8J8NMN2_HALGN|nr:hypothetical protein FGO68_gene6437 [Halteria grandinella]
MNLLGSSLQAKTLAQREAMEEQRIEDEDQVFSLGQIQHSHEVTCSLLHQHLKFILPRPSAALVSLSLSHYPPRSFSAHLSEQQKVPTRLQNPALTCQLHLYHCSSSRPCIWKRISISHKVATTQESLEPSKPVIDRRHEEEPRYSVHPCTSDHERLSPLPEGQHSALCPPWWSPCCSTVQKTLLLSL